MRTDTKNISRGKVVGYFALLLAVLVFIFAPSFTNPLRSDWWSALYAFQLVDASPGPPGFSFIINHDPWRDGTFRPLAHPFLYLEHRLFAADFLSYHLVNFSLYFLSIILLYRLGRQLGIRATILAFFLLFFSVLFTHFDIVSWTFHATMPLGFSSFLFGLILFLRYRAGGEKLLLIPVGCLFLLSLLCLELYVLWPIGILLISGRGKTFRRPVLLTVGTVYGAYFLIYLITRAVPHTSGSLNAPGLMEILLSLCAVFFNLIYNGFLVNLMPFIASPVVLSHNIEMGGPALAWSPALLRTVVIAIGVVSSILLIAVSSSRPARRKVPPFLGWLFFFYATGFFVLALGRSTTENFDDLFLQFRYQYIANAFLALMGALVVDRLVRSAPLRKGICLLLVLAAALNVIAGRRAVAVLDHELAPQKALLARLRRGIEQGEITPSQPVALPDGITSYLSPLCWNEDMGRFFRGTYQWVFSRKDLFCFTPFIRDAAWIVDGKEMNYRPKRSTDPPVLPQRYIAPEYRDRAGMIDPPDAGGGD